MENIKRLTHNRNSRKKDMYKDGVKRIRTKISFFAENNINYLQYKFFEMNYFGYPILNDIEKLKMKNYVVKKLTKEGFAVYDISSRNLFQIIIIW